MTVNTKNSDDTAKDTSYHGHRNRLRKRFLSQGAAALADYEILEMLLFNAFPRRDVKPLAKKILSRYNGSLSAVLSAPPERLKDIEGIGDSAACSLKIVHEAALRMLKEEHHRRPVLSNWQGLNDYLRVAMRHLPVEQFRVLFLNSKNELIADEVQQEGTINAAPVYPREIVRRALDLSATAIILVHNHPSGNPEPSSKDIEVTKQVKKAADALSIILHDHIIVGYGKNQSLKSLGYL